MRRFCTALISVCVVVVLPLLFINDTAVSSILNTEASPWLLFMGKLHPVFLHLPIGIFVYIGCCEFLVIVSRGKFRIDITPALFLGSATSVIATVFGYFLFVTGDYAVSELMDEHKRDGIIFTLLALITLLTKVYSLKRGAKKIWVRCYSILITITLIVLVSASHHGGEISHGSLFEGISKDSKEVLPAHDLVSYESVVKPILAEKCESCHGEEKQKGGLRVDSLELMLEGGDQGPSVVPGDLENSLLISCLYLPLDDDLRMPPESKPQLTSEEIMILEHWVRSGAPVSYK